jgi:toxin ParE1/3/4
LKSYQVFFRSRARKDLIALYRYIAKKSSHGIAVNYIRRIEKTCHSLAVFPQRGTSVPSIVSGLRTMGFERRATILFCVGEDTVEILRVYYGGQDLGPELEKMLGI